MDVKVTWRKHEDGSEKMLKALGFLFEDKQIPGVNFFKALGKAIRAKVPDLFPDEQVTMLWSQTTIQGIGHGDVVRRKISMFTVPSGSTWSCESLLTYNPDTGFVETRVHCVKLDARKF